jgi:Spy/CpxP family protein refolding chaperone
LVLDQSMSIEEAYETGAAASVEVRRVLRDMGDLPARISAVLETDLDREQRQQMKEGIQHLRRALSTVARESGAR